MSGFPVRPFAFASAIAATAFGGGCRDSGSAEYFGTTVRPNSDVATFYVNNGTEPEYLDPGKCNDLASTILVVQLFEGLTSYHPKDLRPIPGAAIRWEQSLDGLRYRFHLRKDARWSDGIAVTARDFEYAWKRVLAPQNSFAHGRSSPPSQKRRAF